ncbi:MAG: DegV family protein [Oscillospiraceae bacterium]|jgi:DegV family protein with EDD domain|nr:DegV family protein [Oscillospiraceae bacterium]
MSHNYVLITDDTCDMPASFYKEHDIPLLRLHFTIDGVSYDGGQMSEPEFYVQLRKGKMPTTAQVGVDQAYQFMEAIAKEGRDILFLAFSSGLSGTAGSGMVAAGMLREKYPERNIRVVDSLCASMGEGLLLHKLVALRDEGKSLDELADWAEANRLNVAHYVAAEDLMHLHKGGRISKTSALMGSMLGIKPMIYVNNEGKLINVGKVRGRRQALQSLVDMAARAVGNTKSDTFCVSHADAREDAEYVAELVKKRLGIENSIIHYIGPVIGSHTGPGAIALFLMADHR